MKYLDLLFVNIAYAAPADLNTLVKNIEVNIINPIIGVFFALALIIFLWGVTRFLMNADNDTEREQGKNHMIWGLVGMFIMVSVIGIIKIIMSIIGVDDIKI